MIQLQLTLKPLPSGAFTFESEKIYIVQTIQTMMRKETTVYKCNDHVLSYNLEKLSIPRADAFQDFMVDDSCRQKMCEWCYRIVDHFNGSRELVAIAQNYLDRFLDQYRCDCTAYKLAAITSLYLAVKIYNRKPISSKSLASLSNGEFLVEDIAEMEDMILKTLDWKMSPPTASSFCGYFHGLLPTSIKPSVRQTILQRSCFFSELAVMNYSFLSFNPSEVAFAAISNSLEGLESFNMSNEAKQDFIRGIEILTEMSRTSERIKMIQDKLWALYRRSKQYAAHDAKKVRSRQHHQNTDHKHDKTPYRGDMECESSPVSCIRANE